MAILYTSSLSADVIFVMYVIYVICVLQNMTQITIWNKEGLNSISLQCWNGYHLPNEWIDGVKGKREKGICDNYRGITLFDPVSKILSRVLLNRLLLNICLAVIPESLSGFRYGRETTDMIFSVRQVQEKCIEQRVSLYQVFVDLTKAFDTVNRDALWTILGK